MVAVSVGEISDSVSTNSPAPASVTNAPNTSNQMMTPDAICRLLSILFPWVLSTAFGECSL